jgi:hypothetical protein
MIPVAWAPMEGVAPSTPEDGPRNPASVRSGSTQRVTGVDGSTPLEEAGQVTAYGAELPFGPARRRPPQ